MALRILFDLGHPAHYHLYKNAIRALRERGDDIIIVVRNREEMVAQLLKEDGQDFVMLGRNVPGLFMKALYMLRNDAKLLRIASGFKPDLFVSMSSPYSAHASFILRRPHLSFTDTEISTVILFLLAPFTTRMITPTSFKGDFSFRSHRKVDSYKELAYLHPKYFRPDPKLLDELKMGRDEKFALIRFSAYDASHDTGLRGLGKEARERLIRELSKRCRVFISSEIPLGTEFEKYELRIPPTKMHDMLCLASLYIGEGAVMASEAAMLGIPSIFINPSSRGYIDDLAKMGLVLHYRNPEKELEEIIASARDILSSRSYAEEIRSKRDAMLRKRTDLTETILEEIERFRKATAVR